MEGGKIRPDSRDQAGIIIYGLVSYLSFESSPNWPGQVTLGQEVPMSFRSESVLSANILSLPSAPDLKDWGHDSRTV